MKQNLTRSTNHYGTLFCLATLTLLGNVATMRAASLASPTSIVEISFAGGGKRDFISTPYVRAGEKYGTIGAVNSITSVTLIDEAAATYANAAFTPGAASVDNKYILEILDGRYIGLVAYIKSNVGNTFTVDEAVLPIDSLLVGSKFVIRKDWTLETLLGVANASSPFLAGSSTASADNINIWNQKTQAYTSYYIRLSSGTYTWRDAVGNASNHTRIPYGQGVQVLRRTTGNGTLTLKGEVRSARMRRDLLANKTALVANLSPSATTIGDMNISIDTASSSAGSVVKVWNATTQAWTPYYRRTSDGKFFDGITVRDTIVVGAGKVVQVLNKTTDKSGTSALTVNPRLP